MKVKQMVYKAYKLRELRVLMEAEKIYCEQLEEKIKQIDIEMKDELGFKFEDITYRQLVEIAGGRL